MKIITVGDLKNLIKDLDDDFIIELRIRRHLKNDEICSTYPYPYITDSDQILEFDDIGYSDKKLCLGVEVDLDSL